MPRSGKETKERIYGYLRSCAAGEFPTVREIAAACGISSPSVVHRHLLALEKEGRITRTAGRARSAGVSRPASTLVPLVGRVAAGLPVTAVEWIEEYLPLPADMAGGDQPFALRVVGESMKNAGILPGDLVICEKTPVAENGEIVVALIDGEATVKRFFHKADRVVLQPENPDFAPIESQSVTLLGRVTAVLRWYR